jgi:Flp pilus assembly protein TadD
VSVLNKVLRDLERRGAPAPEFAEASSSATPMPRAARRRNAVSLRTAVWGGLAAIVCATLGAYSWQVERMKAYAKAAKPLGAAQFEPALPKESVPEVIAAAQAKPTPSLPSTSATMAAVPPDAPDATPAGSPGETPAPKPVADAEAMVTPPAAAAKPPADAAPVARPREAAAPVMKTSVSTQALSSLPADADAVAMTRQPKAQEHKSKTVEPTVSAAASATVPIVTRKTDLAEAQLERAAEFIARGRSHEAIALLTQLLSAQPTHHSARQALAALQAESGRRDLALQTLLAGAALDPARFAIAAARLQAEAGDADGALVTLERVPAAQRDAVYDALVGGLAQRAGQHAVAAEAFARAVRVPSAPAIWWAGLGHSLDSLGQRAQAQLAFKRAISDPALPAGLRSYVNQRLAELAAARPSPTPAVRETAPLAALPN